MTFRAPPCSRSVEHLQFIFAIPSVTPHFSAQFSTCIVSISLMLLPVFRVLLLFFTLSHDIVPLSVSAVQGLMMGLVGYILQEATWNWFVSAQTFFLLVLTFFPVLSRIRVRTIKVCTASVMVVWPWLNSRVVPSWLWYRNFPVNLLNSLGSVTWNLRGWGSGANRQEGSQGC